MPERQISPLSDGGGDDDAKDPVSRRFSDETLRRESWLRQVMRSFGAWVRIVRVGERFCWRWCH
jgi:hypothetical protein